MSVTTVLVGLLAWLAVAAVVALTVGALIRCGEQQRLSDAHPARRAAQQRHDRPAPGLPTAWPPRP